MTLSWHTLPGDLCLDAAPLPAAMRVVPERPFFVIPFAEFGLIECLDATLPLPLAARWINRGTGQPLRPSTVAMLLRTRGRAGRLMPSVVRLHEWSGLRLTFATAEERHRFARCWSELRPRKVPVAA